MKITAEQVKTLREMTDAPMMECKKALVATEGDIEKAAEEMRKLGVTKAAKKASRIAAEGSVTVASAKDNKHAVILEVNCETDFVSRDNNFKAFVEKVAEISLDNKVESVEELLSKQFDTGITVSQAREDLIAKIGENINIRRLQALSVEEGIIGYYVHSGRIGVLVHILGNELELAKDIAMHITASNPRVIAPEDFPAYELQKEREICEAKSKDTGKPSEIVEKMIQGQLNKFLQQVSLLGQPFVKEPEVTVGQLLKNKKSEVKTFIRFEVGEGIEKQASDFREEVMAQVRGGA